MVWAVVIVGYGLWMVGSIKWVFVGLRKGNEGIWKADWNCFHFTKEVFWGGWGIWLIFLTTTAIFVSTANFCGDFCLPFFVIK